MMNAKELIARAEALLLTREHIALKEANAVQLHDALASAAMEALAPAWIGSERARAGKRQAYYLSAEYLVGRMVYNNLFCMGLLEDARALLAEKEVITDGSVFHVRVGEEEVLRTVRALYEACRKVKG